MKVKILAVLFSFLLFLTSCSPSEAVYINDSTPIDVSLDGVTIVSQELSVVARDYFVAIAEEEIAGHRGFSNLAYNNAVGTTQEDIWFGSNTYVFPVAAQQMELVSTSAQDDVGGTGVESVTIYYLDGNYEQQSENVTLDGITVVTTVATDIFRVNDIRALSVGSTGVAVGDIVIRNLADTPAYHYIGAGYTRGRSSIYTVPLGKTLYIHNFYVAVGGLNAVNQARITLRASFDDATDTMLSGWFMPYAEVLLPNGDVDRHFDIPFHFHEKVDVKISGVADLGSAFIEASYRGWIE